MPTLYGLKACDTCRKAAKEMESAGRSVTFRDVRAEPLDAGTIARLLDVFGDALVNRRSTTWRGLSDAERQANGADLLATHPTLMKRPVIEDGGHLTLGWDRSVAAQHLG